MSLKYALLYTSCLCILVLSKPLIRTRQDVTIIWIASANTLKQTLDSISMLNASVTAFNVTGAEDIHIQCDGSSYGFDLDVVDCKEANAYVPSSPDQVLWAESQTGLQEKIFALPYRAMGDKAMCYVQPLLINGTSSARATPNQVRNAAAAIRLNCASGGKLQGGIATNIGKMEGPVLEGHDSIIGLGCYVLSSISILTLCITQVATTTSQ